MIPGFIELTSRVSAANGTKMLIAIAHIAVITPEFSGGSNGSNIFIAGESEAYLCSESYDQVKAMIAEQCKPMLITDSFPHIKED